MRQPRDRSAQPGACGGI